MNGRQNTLLGTISVADHALLAPHLRLTDFVGGQVVAAGTSGERHACFPLTVVAAVAQVMGDGTRYSVGLIGCEGVVGWQAMPGVGTPALHGAAQLSGGAGLMIATDALEAACARSGTLHEAMLRFAQSFAVQVSHTMVAVLRDAIEPRLARWLLMLHDRVDGDVLPLTHDALSAALHVRRASITDALHMLEGERAVRCTRGRVTVRDRRALAALAGDSYGPAEASYRALLGPFGKP